MKSRLFFHVGIFISLAIRSYSQDVFITKPRLFFNENQLSISYDIIADTLSDKFYVWLEIINDRGEPVEAKSLSGDIGKDIVSGHNKKITWVPAEDSVFLNEKIFVQVKAEKYIKSFDRRTMLFKSLIIPGWGQSKVIDKPLWISSIVAYGSVAGGIIYQKRYQKSYDSYRIEEDAIHRTELLKRSQNQLNISTVLIYTSISVLIANFVWIAVVPEKYRPLQHATFSVNPLSFQYNTSPLISLRFDF